MCEVGHVMRENGCAIALIQEPYADSSGMIRGLPDTMQVYANRDASAAVLVDDRTIQCIIVTAPEDKGIAVRCEGSFGDLIACSVYCRFSEPLPPYLDFLDRVLPLAGRSPVIIAMDANASSPMWFSKSTVQSRRSVNRTRGEMLGEWIVTQELYPVNEASEWYTFDGPNGVSDIDVTVVNDEILRKYSTQWRILDGHSVSDHNPIVLTLSPIVNDEPTVLETTLRWRTRQIDWQNYTEELCAYADTQCPIANFEGMQLDEKLATIRTLIYSVNDRALGRLACRRNNSKVLWWTRELTRKRQEVVRRRRKYQRARRRQQEDITAARKEDLRVTLLEYKQMLRKSKERDWSQFVERNKDNPWGSVYRMCRREVGKSKANFIQSNGRYLYTWRECTRALLERFFPRAQQEHDVYGPDNQPVELTYLEVKLAVGKIRSDVAPGLDGLTGRMIKAVWNAIPHHVLALYCHCLREGHFPQQWKTAKTVVLLKSVDRPRTNAGSYRGICLLSALGKVLEHVMVERLMDRLGGSFSRYQFGFQEQRCTEDAWMYVQSCIRSSGNKYVLGIFIDFKGAFDHLEWPSILQRLQDVGCTEMELWRHYFDTRRAKAVNAAGTNEVMVTVERGCPQGSIIGPYVWNLMMDVLLQQLEPWCRFSAYADDLLLLIEGNSRMELETMGARLMAITWDWGVKVGVSVSTEKTVMMLMKGKLDVRRPPHIVYGNSSILQYATEVRYLGIVVGERLNFLPHLKTMQTKMTKVVTSLKRALRVKGGLSRKSVRTIYKGLFVPCAVYGAAVWYERVRNAVELRWVLSCQRITLLVCLPVCRTVSTDALQVLAGALPWDLEVIRCAIGYKLRKGIPLLPTDWLFNEDLGSMTHEERKLQLLDCAYAEWQTRWDNSLKGRVTFGFIPRVKFAVEDPTFGFSLRLGFLITGHGSLGSFLRTRALTDDPMCTCGAEEDWRHVLCCCPLYADIRNLDAFGVTYDANAPDLADFSTALTTPERVQSLEAFAHEAFSRRYALRTAQNAD